MKIILIILLLLLPNIISAQRKVHNDWITELGGGASANLFTRGPWINDSWKHSFTKRIGLSNGISLFYEFIIEPWNRQTNAGKISDVNKRFLGILSMELLWAIGKKIQKIN